MVDHAILIDDSLRLVLARLEGALGVNFRAREIEQVFADARQDQRSEKRYVFFESATIRVTGYVEDYEPETIEIAIDAPRSDRNRCRQILDAVKVR